MNNLINQLREKVQVLQVGDSSIPYAELRELQSSISNLLSQLSEHNQKLAKAKTLARLAELQKLTNYEEPVYPEISYESGDAEEVSEGENGSCILESPAVAEELINILVSQSYYYGHNFKWQGPGKYRIIPTWSWDHDGEVIYTATYEKEAV